MNIHKQVSYFIAGNFGGDLILAILAALFLQIGGKGPGPFKRGKVPKLGKKSHSERKIDNVLE